MSEVDEKSIGEYFIAKLDGRSATTIAIKPQKADWTSRVVLEEDQEQHVHIPPLPSSREDGILMNDTTTGIFVAIGGSEVNRSKREHLRSGEARAGPDAPWVTLPARKVARPGESISLTSPFSSTARLFVVGGATQAGASDVCELLDITRAETNKLSVATWRRFAPLPKGRHSHGAVVIGDRLYVVGGRDGAGTTGRVLRDILCLDLRSLDRLPSCSDTSSTSSDEGDLLSQTPGSPIGPRTIRRSAKWRNVGELEEGRFNPGVVALMGRFLVVVGGYTGIKVLDSVEIFDTWRGVCFSGPPVLHARHSAFTTVLNHPLRGPGILVLGGSHPILNRAIVTEAEIWYPSDQSGQGWILQPDVNPPEPSNGHSDGVRKNWIASSATLLAAPETNIAPVFSAADLTAYDRQHAHQLTNTGRWRAKQERAENLQKSRGDHIPHQRSQQGLLRLSDGVSEPSPEDVPARVTTVNSKQRDLAPSDGVPKSFVRPKGWYKPLKSPEARRTTDKPEDIKVVPSRPLSDAVFSMFQRRQLPSKPTITSKVAEEGPFKSVLATVKVGATLPSDITTTSPPDASATTLPGVVSEQASEVSVYSNGPSSISRDDILSDNRLTSPLDTSSVSRSSSFASFAEALSDFSSDPVDNEAPTVSLMPRTETVPALELRRRFTKTSDLLQALLVESNRAKKQAEYIRRQLNEIRNKNQEQRRASLSYLASLPPLPPWRSAFQSPTSLVDSPIRSSTSRPLPYTRMNAPRPPVRAAFGPKRGDSDLDYAASIPDTCFDGAGSITNVLYTRKPDGSRITSRKSTVEVIPPAEPASIVAYCDGGQHGSVRIMGSWDDFTTFEEGVSLDGVQWYCPILVETAVAKAIECQSSNDRVFRSLRSNPSCPGNDNHVADRLCDCHSSVLVQYVFVVDNEIRLDPKTYREPVGKDKADRHVVRVPLLCTPGAKSPESLTGTGASCARLQGCDKSRFDHTSPSVAPTTDTLIPPPCDSGESLMTGTKLRKDIVAIDWTPVARWEGAVVRRSRPFNYPLNSRDLLSKGWSLSSCEASDPHDPIKFLRTEGQYTEATPG